MGNRNMGRNAAKIQTNGREFHSGWSGTLNSIGLYIHSISRISDLLGEQVFDSLSFCSSDALSSAAFFRSA